jgi:hypothetical protein
MRQTPIPQPPCTRRVLPSVSLLQGKPWTPSHNTNIRATLDKAREQLKESKQ